MADPLHSDTVLKRHRPTRARSAYSHAAVPAKRSIRCHSQNGRRGSCSSYRWPRERARCLPRPQEGHGIAHGRLPIDFRHATTMALMAPVIAARELCCCSIPGARTAACAAEQFLGASFVQALVCAQAASTSTIRDGFGRGPFAPCSCLSLACPSAAARSACSSAVARSDDADSPGAFHKLWRWRHCLVVSRVAAPAGLWWSAACAGGPPRHGCATRRRPECGDGRARTSRIACAMGWACPHSLAGGRDSRRRFRLVWPSLFEEELFVWPFRLPYDNVFTSPAELSRITLR